MQLLIIILLLLPGSLFAQERGGGRGAAPLPPPKNLKLLDPKTEIRFVMQSFNEALGVQCTHCHMQGDFASDENPKRSEEHTSELQSPCNLVCRLLLEK